MPTSNEKNSEGRQVDRSRLPVLRSEDKPSGTVPAGARKLKKQEKKDTVIFSYPDQDNDREKRKIIFAEPAAGVTRDRNVSLGLSIGCIAGIVICIVVIVLGFARYNYLLWMIWILLFLVILFLRGGVGWMREYFSRTRFRIYEDGVVPSYIPAMAAIKGMDFVIPFSSLKGMSLKRRQRPNGSTEWICEFRLPDDRTVEIFGTQDDMDVYNYMLDVKGRYALEDMYISGRQYDGTGVKERISSGFREQLKRWGVEEEKDDTRKRRPGEIETGKRSGKL